MLDERRVKRMVKLAAYETKSGAEDFKVNDYFQKDYVSFQVLCTFIWVTVGYIAILAVLGITYLGQMVEETWLCMSHIISPSLCRTLNCSLGI